MSHTLLDLAYQLTKAGEPFVLATVVWCERPTSAKPGAQAIIQKNGQLTGWIGGSCAQPVVVREAMRVLREGADPYLLRLGSSDVDKTMARRDVRTFPMTCTSGGTLDIYMEPHLPQPRLVLVGNSPVIVTLRQLAPMLNFAITQIEHADLSQIPLDEHTYVLVATHGQYDEDVLEQVLPSAAAYVGMIGSHKRAEECRSYLRAADIAEEYIARLRSPAGIDIGAITPEEIAASILAELVQVHRRKSQQRETVAEKQSEAREHAMSAVSVTAIDPVCGMTVEIANTRQHCSYEGQDFYFCCAACKRLFERNPQEYFVRHN